MIPDTETMSKFFGGNRRRKNALEVVVYDMQGGPLPDRLQQEIKTAIADLVKQYDAVAWFSEE